MEWTKEAIEDLIKELLNISELTPLIKKQLAKFVLENKMTYKEIGRCLVYYSDVLKREFQTSLFGIAVVPNVREEANRYFEQLALEIEEREKEAQKVKNYEENNIVFNIDSVKHEKRKPKQLNIGEIDVERKDN